MNITLSADERIVKRARAYAQSHGTSLNQLVRDYLEALVGERSPAEAAAEFAAVARSMGGDSGGRSWTGREEVYQERIDPAPRTATNGG